MGVPAKSCRDAMVNLSLLQKMLEVPTFKRYSKYQICNMDPNISGTRNWKIETLGSVRPTNGLDQTKTGQKFTIYLFWSVWILESVKHWKLHETTTTHCFQRSLKFGQNPSNPNTTHSRKNKKMKPSIDSNHFNNELIYPFAALNFWELFRFLPSPSCALTACLVAQ